MQTSVISRHTVEDFLVHEAELLDEGRFEEWHALFTAEGTYVIPLSDEGDPSRYASLVYDDPLRLEERVYHLSQVPFPSQSPRSRTLHLVSNVRVRSAESAGSRFAALSNQVICEMRLGDFRQVGLGEQRVFAAEVRHELEVHGESEFRIASKTIRLLNRGAPMSNLTFLL
jgi:3-phenylpropionate/cinnamic acid dioxygenase small subunit